MPLVLILGLAAYLMLSKDGGAAAPVVVAQASSTQVMAQPSPPVEPPSARAVAESNSGAILTPDMPSTILGPGGSQTPLGPSAIATQPDPAQMTQAALGLGVETLGMPSSTVQGPSLRWDPMSRSWY